MYVSIVLGVLILITLSVYIGLISSDKYINKNSDKYSTATIEQKKYIGYTNMVGNILAIFICGFDGIMFTHADKITIDKYIIKLVILMLFIAFSFDVSVTNDSYGVFISALQPITGYLQVLSIATIVQIILKLDKNILSKGRPRGRSFDDILTSDSDGPLSSQLESEY